MFKKVLQFLKRHYVLFLLPTIVVFCMELLSRSLYSDTIVWSFQNIFHFILNIIVIFSLLLFFFAMIGNTKASYWILSPVLLILAIVSGVKFKILGVPLLPWDFVLTSETQDMVPYLANLFNWQTISAIILFLGLSFIVLHRLSAYKKSFHWKERAALAVFSIILLAWFYTDQPYSVKRVFAVQNMSWDQAQNVKTNGFALMTIMNTNLWLSDKIDNYDSESIESIVNQNNKDSQSNGQRPNIIFVLSESLWDMTQVESLTFSQDPLPTFHELQKSFSHGMMLSPQFGGGTANVEFEILTGNSMRFFPQGSVPYNQYIDRGIDSIASILARQGYKSTMMNPFHNWYFNSNQVNRYFGFSNFISLEFFDPNYAGPYISDLELANTIIDEVNKYDGPNFIFAASMENHFHYYPGKFDENTIRVDGDGLVESKGLLETYAQGSYGSDLMLKKLVEYYEHHEEPTIIVFFGDHLPYLGDNYKAFVESGYITGENDPDFLEKIYSVPLLIWDNYLNLEPEHLNMSPSFLSPYVLNIAGISGSYYTNFLYDLYEKIPVIPPQNYYEKYGIQAEDLDEYEQLQYDIIFGDQHAYKGWSDQIIDPNFVVGFGPMKINHVQSDDSGKSLDIFGENLPWDSKVFINGKLQKSEQQNREHLRVQVPNQLWSEDEWEIEVRVIDSKDMVPAQSNVHTFNPVAQ